jgi:HK97 family phage prohead protease
MLHGADIGTLELRASKNGARKIRGRFPYNKKAVLSDGGKRGRPQKEQFAPGAFSHSINSAEQEIHLLSGHDFAKPLASKNTGTLLFKDTVEALTFDAIIAPEVADTSYGADLLKLIGAGLVFGLSPGFRIPPPAAVPPDQAEKVEEEPPSLGRAIIRTILEAILFELSIVTRPAYDEAQVEMRNWQVSDSGLVVPKPHPLARWRL